MSLWGGRVEWEGLYEAVVLSLDEPGLEILVNAVLGVDVDKFVGVVEKMVDGAIVVYPSSKLFIYVPSVLPK